MDKNQLYKAKPNVAHKDLRVTIKDAFIEAHTCFEEILNTLAEHGALLL